jgi:hypothetical protein
MPAFAGVTGEAKINPCLSPLSPLSTGRTPDSPLGATHKSVPICSCRREAAFRKRETLPVTARRRMAEVRKNGSVSKPGSGQPEGRSARQRRKPKPNPLSFEGPAEPEAFGWKEPRKDVGEASLHRSPTGNLRSKPQGGGRRNPPGNRRPAARQGSEPAGTRARSAMIWRKEPEGPTGAARPRPEPPWERRPRLHGQSQRNQGQWRPAAMPASISFWGGPSLPPHRRWGGGPPKVVEG